MKDNALHFSAGVQGVFFEKAREKSAKNPF